MTDAAITASEAIAAMTAGRLRARDYLEACLARIGLRDGTVKGWVHLDIVGARTAAEQLDAGGTMAGPLHGIPVGIKDVIDVAGMPTTHGSPIFADNIAEADAACVVLLRAAGAIVLGKTVTAEFATYSPGPTTNPANSAHTPGGSSSGSAAVVADGQVPLALGTQTAGSVIRPASFCGCFGYKPTLGRYPKQGCLVTSPSLDHIGAFARSVEDVALLDSVLGQEATAQPAMPSRIAVCIDGPWPRVSQDMREAVNEFTAACRSNGTAVIEAALPRSIGALFEAQKRLHAHEAWLALGDIREAHDDAVSRDFAALMDAGEGERNYADLLTALQRGRDAAQHFFAEFDMLLTPGAPGAAPATLKQTGDPALQRIWTAIGAPGLGIPGGRDDAGMPIGLQLVAAPGSDRTFLAQARAVLAKTATEASHAL